MRAIFEAALSRPAAERRPYVACACDGDSGVRREVEALLAADQSQVRVGPELGTVVWFNGADLDPDVLQSQLTGQPIEL